MPIKQGDAGKEGAMRCPKCGYFSFDHLDKCAKCDKEMTEVRQDLNLQDFEPEVPFLLGSLVGDMQGAAGGDDQGLSLTKETDLALSGLDTSGPITMEGTMDMEGMEQTLDAGAVGDLELDEISLDDLGDIEAGGAEIELEELPAGEDEGFMGLEVEMDELEETLAGEDVSDLELIPDDETVDASPEAAVDTASEEPMFELDLDDNDLTALADELDTGLGEEPAADVPELEPAASKESGSDVGLSEDDLSALAEELEESFIAESEEGKKAGAGEDASDLDEIILDLEEE
jgi:hypothetical protein